MQRAGAVSLQLVSEMTPGWSRTGAYGKGAAWLWVVVTLSSSRTPAPPRYLP